MHEGSGCTACNKGALVRTRVRRMPGLLVVVGFILFVPATLGVVAGAIGAVGTGMVASQADRSPDEIRGELQGLKVPEALIDRALAGDLDPRADFTGLSQEQRAALFRGQLATIARKAPTRDLVVGSLVMLGVSLAAGVVGWFFIRKKWVLRCPECEAVATGDEP